MKGEERARWLARRVALTTLLGMIGGCGLDITFDEENRELIQRYDPDASVGVDAPVEPDTDAERPMLARVDHLAWGGIVSRYLVGGCFDYDALSGSDEARGVLALYLDQLGRVDLDAALTPDERRALWINAYNAFVVAAVVQEREANPSFRVDEANFAFFKDARFVVGGLLLSLDQIEHGALRGDQAHASLIDMDAATRARVLEEAQATAPFDPRIHFAVNCASRSCPDLRPGAFEGALLDAQLDEQARRFLDDPAKGAGPDGVSSLFDWFRADFEAVAPVTEFIGQHRTGGLEGVDTSTFLSYDWALNAISATHPQCEP